MIQKPNNKISLLVSWYRHLKDSAHVQKCLKYSLTTIIKNITPWKTKLLLYISKKVNKVRSINFPGYIN